MDGVPEYAGNAGDSRVPWRICGATGPAPREAEPDASPPNLAAVECAPQAPLLAIRDEIELLAEAVDRAAEDIALVDTQAASRLERRLASRIRGINAALEPLRRLTAELTRLRPLDADEADAPADRREG